MQTQKENTLMTGFSLGQSQVCEKLGYSGLRQSIPVLLLLLLLSWASLTQAGQNTTKQSVISLLTLRRRNLGRDVKLCEGKH